MVLGVLFFILGFVAVTLPQEAFAATSGTVTATVQIRRPLQTQNGNSQKSVMPQIIMMLGAFENTAVSSYRTLTISGVLWER